MFLEVTLRDDEGNLLLVRRRPANREEVERLFSDPTWQQAREAREVPLAIERLLCEAGRQSRADQPRQSGVPPFRVADPEMVARMFEEWRKEDAQDHIESYEVLKAALNEGRAEEDKVIP